ncbi:MAG TPA: phosphoglucosamine mutase [Chitinophagales bacterium]|nr:phosphoglucosamine mutase [Chitinophagales bacterium]
MPLIKSISGIRGTIGGKAGENLTPEDVVKFTAAFASWVKQKNKKNRMVIGRDARISGKMVSALVSSTLQAMGVDVVDLGLSTTPTVELMVTDEKAGGGIIITASHNPMQWNALKLLNDRGEFISESEGKKILAMADAGNFVFAEIAALGSYRTDESAIEKHIGKIKALSLVNRDAIKEQKYKVVVDGVNSSGGIAVPQLLKSLGVSEVIELNCEPTGKFAHNPEPLPENLVELSQQVKFHKAHLGIAVDPDVDRLAMVCEDGSMFGEEYTLVAVADYVLQHRVGNTVSNLSSTRALKDITEKYGAKYFASPVGEVHVVTRMKEANAVIGGEGNGGIIYPEFHYGRDALVGIALFLSHLAASGKTCSVLRATYPNYIISKNKIQLTPEVNIDRILSGIEKKYSSQPTNTEDGLKIEFDGDWVHLRRSNTEPIIRIYSESEHETTANNLAKKIMQDIQLLMKES